MNRCKEFNKTYFKEHLCLFRFYKKSDLTFRITLVLVNTGSHRNPLDDSIKVCNFQASSCSFNQFKEFISIYGESRA